MSETARKRTAGKLALVALGMFGFGYLLVPLYDVFCDVTGLNGKTGNIAAQDADALEVDQQRIVTVEFDTNVRAMSWEFQPVHRKIKVHPGEVTRAVFTVENKSSKAIVGRAVPSVAPQQASLYFNKTECFCFTEQRLEPGERREMTVGFVVDPELPERFGALILSYTFFNVTDKDKVAHGAAGSADNNSG
jgi:cytochrome c oxidase assembly protein subunit 11